MQCQAQVGPAVELVAQLILGIAFIQQVLHYQGDFGFRVSLAEGLG